MIYHNNASHLAPLAYVYRTVRSRSGIVAKWRPREMLSEPMFGQSLTMCVRNDQLNKNEQLNHRT